MYRKPFTDEEKNECIRLRVEDKLSLSEIAERTKISQSTLSVLLRQYPLSHNEKLEKQINRYKQSIADKKQTVNTVPSKLYELAKKDLTTHDKGKIAESAVLLRLVLNKITVYGSVFDGDKADWIINIPDTNLSYKIQVRWVNTQKQYGQGTIILTCSDGHSNRRTYEKHEFDFLVGYDLFHDCAYVYSFDELNSKTAINVQEEHKERWDKILGH